MKTLYPDKATRDRFWSKVKIVNDWDSCWEWQGSRDGYGYGMFRIGPGRVRRAHRVAYETQAGRVADGTVFLHSCDNPPCVRPSHVRPGTRAENNADRDAKGRQRTPTKLSFDQVLQMRAWSTYGFSQSEIGRWFGVSSSCAHNIITGKKRVTA